MTDRRHAFYRVPYSLTNFFNYDFFREAPPVKIDSSKVSDMLESETKKMEEKLSLVKKMMELERDKRSAVKPSNQGTLWRGASTKKDIKGYGNAVVDHHKKAQPNLPPTHVVTDPSGNANRMKQVAAGATKRVPSGVRRGSASRGGVRQPSAGKR